MQKQQLRILFSCFQGADISKDDGVYSRHVVKLEKGTYHVSFKVIGENGKVWTKEENLDINTTHNRKCKMRNSHLLTNVKRSIAVNMIRAIHLFF